MSKKPLIIMGSLLVIILGSAIILPRLGSSTGSNTSISSPLSILPDREYSQIVWISPDDQIRSYIGSQFGNNQAIIDTLAQVEEFTLVQRYESGNQETLMTIYGKNIQTNIFTTLGLMNPTPGYQFEQINTHTIAYGPKNIVAAIGKTKDRFQADELATQFIQDKKESGSTVGLLSRPSGALSAGFGLPISQKMLGTLAHIDFGADLIPQGTIDIYFEDGVIETGSSSRYPLETADQKGGSLVLGHILELLGIDETGVITFLPFVLEQYLGDSVALMNDADYARIYAALDDAVRIDMAAGELGNAYVMTMGDAEIFDTLEKVAPFVQPQLQAQIGEGKITTEFTANQLTWMVETAQGSFPYLSIYKGVTSTSLGLFTDDFDIYTRAETAIDSDVLGTLSISPRLLPVTNTLTGKSFRDGVTQNIEGEITLDEENQRLRLEIE